MADTLSQPDLRQPATHLVKVLALLTSPAIVIFLSSNFVNAGNLAFNVLFSRWMGPEVFGDLALILTIKLAVLGIWGAIQMSVSQSVASQGGENAHLLSNLGRLNVVCFAGLWLGLPFIGAAMWAWDAAGLLGLGNSRLLFILMFSMPFAAPLSIFRGIAFGQGRTGRIVLTANVEMGVRLIGAVLAWNLGFGIEGVVVAISLSIVAGTVVLFDLVSYRSPEPDPRALKEGQSAGHFGLAKTIGIAALPFGVLQLAQVICLDGEIFLSSVVLSDRDVGFIAALSLFQRIEFFACFALASILLPNVIRAASDNRSIIASAAPVGALYLCVVAPFLTLVFFFPETMITLLVGPEFVEAARALFLASLSAAAFTLSYLLATLLIALQDKRGIWLIAGTAGLQLAAMCVAAFSADPDFETLIAIKAAFQGALAIRLCIFATWKLTRKGTLEGTR